jgi:DNA-binding MarR family transcriptional regulator
MKATPEKCADLILEATPLVMRSVRTEVAQYVGSGTTLPQFRVLSHLNRGDQCLSDLAARQHVSLATMSKIVTGLVDRGYVERAAEGTDRRYITLRLTSKGQRFFDKTNAHTHQKIMARVESLSSEERQRIVAGLQVLESVFAEKGHHRRDEATLRPERKLK